MSLIEIRHISKIYNEGHESEVRALDNVSMRIENSEFVTILGQSGSGKSTLMNILGCLDIPTYGEYLLEGEHVSRMRLSKLSTIRNQKIGFIFQGFNLIPALTALENVELPLIYRGVKPSLRKELAFEALKSVDLAGRINHRPTEMSGGQQQRVAIARAISTRPPIIMADEPTGNLDSQSGHEIMEKLKDLNEAGTTVLLITHDNKLAEYAKRVITISDGKIQSDINKSDVYAGRGAEA
ncbi:MAG: ABC transporter ATP-binding protein [Bacillota bacterium]|nr:ABC transporter ATP-binding protein [Bacillota bacterium]